MDPGACLQDNDFLKGNSTDLLSESLFSIGDSGPPAIPCRGKTTRHYFVMRCYYGAHNNGALGAARRRVVAFHLLANQRF